MREKAYAVTTDTLFTPAKSGYPFRFIVQIAFENPPAFRKTTADDAGAAYFDEQPWEFPYIAEEVERRVQERLRDTHADGDPVEQQRRTEALQASVAFASFQRFFRDAFAERYGRDFPLERLTALAAELRAQQPTGTITPRWELNVADAGKRPSETEVMLQALRDLPRQEVAGALSTQITAWCDDLEQEVTAERKHLAAVLDALRTTTRDHSWEAAWRQLWSQRNAARMEWENRWAKRIAAETQNLDPAGAGNNPADALARDVAEFMRKNTACITLRRELGVAEEESAAFQRLTSGQVASISARVDPPQH